MRYLKKILFMTGLILSVMPSPGSAQYLKHFQENIGIDFQQYAFDTKSGKSKVFRMISMPLLFRFYPSRYLSIQMKMEQGEYFLSNESLFGMADMEIDWMTFITSSLTLNGGVIIPIGKKELTRREFELVSMSKLPIIEDPLKFARSGFGGHIGASFAYQFANEGTFGLGLRYFYRGAYMPIESGYRYDPSDEIRISAGLHLGNRKSLKIMLDGHFSLFSQDKLDGRMYTEKSNAYVLAFRSNLAFIRIQGLLYRRDESQTVYGYAYQAPDILSGKIGICLFTFMVPYVGYRKSGEGTYTPASTAFLGGIWFEDFQTFGYPMSPYLELFNGTMADHLNASGFRIGTDLDFQVY